MSHADIFIGRQPIFDKNSRLYAYELLFRDDISINNAGAPCPQGATETVIHNAILGFGLDELVGPQKAFINFPESFFHSEVDPAFSPENVVIEVLEHVRPTEEVIAGLTLLKQQGFILALDDFIFKREFIPFLKLADIVKVDVLNLSNEKIPLIFSKIKGVTPAKLLAEKVETRETYQACLGAGVDYFQGYFFAKPEIVQGKKISVAKLSLMALLQKISDPQISLDTLQNIVERDVGLSHKLLKMALQYRTRTMPEFNTIKEVMTLFGLKRVQLWATMLTMSSVDDVVPEVFVMALTRAIFMREIAVKQGLTGTDAFYLTGLLSLLDVIMGQEMEQVLKPLPLNQGIIDGLVLQQGDYWRLLSMAHAYEQSKSKAMGSDYGLIYLNAFKESRKIFK